MTTNRSCEKETSPKQLTKTRLLSRGWTEKTIKELLPPPLLVKNPHYHCGHPMQLWAEETVLARELSEEFIKSKEQKEVRSAAAKRSAEQRGDALLLQVSSIEITVDAYAEDDLRKLTVVSKQEWEDQKGNWDFDCMDIPAQTMERWMVNFLRHHATNYDSAIDSLFRRVGKQRAYVLLKSRTLDSIAQAYPYLADECRRQKGCGYALSCLVPE